MADNGRELSIMGDIWAADHAWLRPPADNLCVIDDIWFFGGPPFPDAARSRHPSTLYIH
jgi:hypothetical protein